MAKSIEPAKAPPYKSIRTIKRHPSSLDFASAWEWIQENQGLIVGFMNKYQVGRVVTRDEIMSGLLETVAKCYANFDDSRRILFTTYAGKSVEWYLRSFHRRRLAASFRFGITCIGAWKGVRPKRVDMPAMYYDGDQCRRLAHEESIDRAIRFLKRTIRLSQRERMILLLHYVAGRTLTEIAAVFNICPARAGQILNKAKRQARATLTAYDMDPYKEAG